MKSPVHRDNEVAGGPIPPKCEIIEIRLAELNQIFNRMDPSPFQDKDLDPKAEEFIVGWAREVSRNAPLALTQTSGFSRIHSIFWPTVVKA